MKLTKYRLRLKNAHRENVYSYATVLAPGAYVAALWYQQYRKSDVMPEVIEKNNTAYSVGQSANNAYRRAMKMDKRFSKLKKSQKDELIAKDKETVKQSQKFFDQCELIDEKPYVEV